MLRELAIYRNSYAPIIIIYAPFGERVAHLGAAQSAMDR
jgi:hypothetical protein